MMTNYIFNLHEDTFDLATDEIIFKVVSDEGTITVNSLKDAYVTVKMFLDENIPSHIVIERLHFVKSVYAMNQDGKWLFQYYQVWRSMSVFNYRLEFNM